MKQFSDSDVQELAHRRARIMISALFVGVVAMLFCLGLAGFWRDTLVGLVERNLGGTAATFLPMVLVLFAITLFLTPVALAENRAKKYSLICPVCSLDLTRSTSRVLATRCCNECGERIIEAGKARKGEVYDRLRQIQMRHFLVYWLWAWPVTAVVTLAAYWLNPSSLYRCLQILFVPSLIGTAAAGWGLLRIRDRRFLPQFAASVVLLGIGSWIFWNAFW